MPLPLLFLCAAPCNRPATPPAQGCAPTDSAAQCSQACGVRSPLRVTAQDALLHLPAPGLADDRLSAMIIADGQHLPADALATIVRAKGLSRIILTSDASPVAGLPDGPHECFGSTVHVEGSFVRSADRTCLAGSGALMIQCVNHLATLRFNPRADGERSGEEPGGLTTSELVRLGFDNPLRAIGQDPAAVRRRLRTCTRGVAVPSVQLRGRRFVVGDG